MEWQLAWFLLAGFLLGFACSTLWEWLYYRGVRQRKLALLRTATETNVPSIAAAETALVERPETVVDAHYRSPAVFIEGEKTPVMPESSQLTYEPVDAPWQAVRPPIAATESTPTTEISGPRPIVEPVEQTAT
jgi:hypothetical protein